MEEYRITSTSNDKIKYLKKLEDKKFRDEEGCFMVENLRTIHDAIKSDILPLELFITNDLLDKDDEKLDYVLSNADEICVINNKINNSFSNLSTPSGICAVFEKVNKSVDFSKKIIYLNAISDPGNLGTILRTALAFDFCDIVVDEKCTDIYNFKTINASKDAIFKLNISSDKNLELFKKIKESKKVYSSVMKSDEVKDVKKIKGDKYCIVFGNEANGIDKKILDESDGFISIEINDKIESLNVAIASSIILYELNKN